MCPGGLHYCCQDSAIGTTGIYLCDEASGKIARHLSSPSSGAVFVDKWITPARVQNILSTGRGTESQCYIYASDNIFTSSCILKISVRYPPSSQSLLRSKRHLEGHVPVREPKALLSDVRFETWNQNTAFIESLDWRPALQNAIFFQETHV